MYQSENGIPVILMNFSGSSRERTHSGHEKVSVTRAGSLLEYKNRVCMGVEKKGVLEGAV